MRPGDRVTITITPRGGEGKPPEVLTGYLKSVDLIGREERYPLGPDDFGIRPAMPTLEIELEPTTSDHP